MRMIRSGAASKGRWEESGARKVSDGMASIALMMRRASVKMGIRMGRGEYRRSLNARAFLLAISAFK